MGGVGGGGVRGMGVGGGMGGGGMGGMSSTTLMNLFNDGSFDMSALFSSGDLPLPVSAGTPTSSNGDGMDRMVGVVGSP